MKTTMRKRQKKLKQMAKSMKHAVQHTNDQSL